MAWANERAVLMIEEGITAMRRSPFPRPDQKFIHGQIELAYAVGVIFRRRLHQLIECSGCCAASS
ncbi:hypothetical protein KUC60_32125 [Pseudomonas aeruginosa]|uniref:hypothetical protein n=1 Tax=Pseudomonas aeruginosa TaxID=287 RepID=UPI00398C7BDC|nr:hypothetical protein [Pseudomonas aeruginosa]